MAQDDDHAHDHTEDPRKQEQGSGTPQAAA